MPHYKIFNHAAIVAMKWTTMASSSFYSAFFFVSLLSLLHHPVLSTSHLHTKSRLFPSQKFSLDQISTQEITTPSTLFEVTKPIILPKTQPCSYQLLQHDFGFTYGSPSVLAPVSPPSPTNGCPSQNFDKIVFELTATSKGVQFDRIFGVWIGGVEVLRSSTAEPSDNGIVWTVEKDITRYSSLFKTNQTLAVYLGNLVNPTYTGVYHVNISIHFYPAAEKIGVPMDNFDSGADLILPISRNLSVLDGLWFEIENSNDVESKEFQIPQNVYRAVLEVYVSYHENDEFWYTNAPNEYIKANNLSGTPGNGPFRELVVSLDDQLLGAVWPFTVIFTGGLNPLLWRPITAIGSFNLPSYDIEITPLLGKILDGNTHRFGFSVANGLNVWKVDANLHLWLDKKSAKTEGKILESYVSLLNLSVVSNYSGYDGTFLTNASKLITNRGWVKSSFGTIVTTATQGFQYNNVMVFGNEGNMQIVNQTIQFDDKVIVQAPFSSPRSLESIKSFPLYVYTNAIVRGNNSYDLVVNVTLGFNEKKIKVSGSGRSVSSTLKNLQSGQGSRHVIDNSVQSGMGSTQQVYKFGDDKSCYFRSISSSNDIILYDNVNLNC